MRQQIWSFAFRGGPTRLQLVAAMFTLCCAACDMNVGDVPAGSCSYRGARHDEGDTFAAADGCGQCRCGASRVTCTVCDAGIRRLDGSQSKSGDLAVQIRTGGATPSRVELDCASGCVDVEASAPNNEGALTYVWSNGANAATQRICTAGPLRVTVISEAGTEFETMGGATIEIAERECVDAGNEGGVPVLEARETCRARIDMEHSGLLYQGGMAVDSSDNVVIASGFFGTLSVGNQSNTTTPNAFGVTGGHAYVAKFDSHCELVWLRAFGAEPEILPGAPSGFTISSVDTDPDGSIFIGGVVRGNLNSELGTVAGGVGSGFLAKLNPDGSLRYIQSYSSLTSSWVEQVAVDSQGRVTILGEGGADTSIAGSPALGTFSFGLSRIRFIAQLENDGRLRWLNVGDPGQVPTLVGVDPSDRVAVTDGVESAQGDRIVGLDGEGGTAFDITTTQTGYAQGYAVGSMRLGFASWDTGETTIRVSSVELAAGSTAWTREFASVGDSVFGSLAPEWRVLPIAMNREDSIVHAYRSTRDRGVNITRLDRDGAPIWSSTIGDDSLRQFPWEVDFASDGSVFALTYELPYEDPTTITSTVEAGVTDAPDSGVTDAPDSRVTDAPDSGAFVADRAGALLVRLSP